MSNRKKLSNAGGRHVPQHRKQPSPAAGEQATAPGRSGATKLAIAGLASATLAIPAIAALASPTAALAATAPAAALTPGATAASQASQGSAPNTQVAALDPANQPISSVPPIQIGRSFLDPTTGLPFLRLIPFDPNIGPIDFGPGQSVTDATGRTFTPTLDPSVPLGVITTQPQSLSSAPANNPGLSTLGDIPVIPMTPDTLKAIQDLTNPELTPPPPLPPPTDQNQTPANPQDGSAADGLTPNQMVADDFAALGLPSQTAGEPTPNQVVADDFSALGAAPTTLAGLTPSLPAPASATISPVAAATGPAPSSQATDLVSSGVNTGPGFGNLIPTTLANPPLVGPDGPPTDGIANVSGFATLTLPLNPSDSGPLVNLNQASLTGTVNVTPADIDKMPVGSIPLNFSLANPLAPPAGSASPTLPASTPDPLFPTNLPDAVASDSTLSGLVNAAASGSLSPPSSAELAAASDQVQQNIQFIDSINLNNGVSAVPFVGLTAQAEQAVAQTLPDSSVSSAADLAGNVQGSSPTVTGQIPASPAVASAQDPPASPNLNTNGDVPAIPLTPDVVQELQGTSTQPAPSGPNTPSNPVQVASNTVNPVANDAGPQAPDSTGQSAATSPSATQTAASGPTASAPSAPANNATSSTPATPAAGNPAAGATTNTGDPSAPANNTNNPSATGTQTAGTPATTPAAGTTSTGDPTAPANNTAATPPPPPPAAQPVAANPPPIIIASSGNGADSGSFA